jgi:Spy/CpxP family protein refolding chaperone
MACPPDQTKIDIMTKTMKNHNLLRCTIAALAASVLLTYVPVASAQNANQGQGQGQGRGRGGGGLPNATEEQTAALQQVNTETRELNQKLNQARTDLNNAIYAEKVDEGAIKAKVAALAKAEEELSIARAKAFAKVRSKFTSEQIDALKARGGGGGGGRQGARRGQ